MTVGLADLGFALDVLDNPLGRQNITGLGL